MESGCRGCSFQEACANEIELHEAFISDESALLTTPDEPTSQELDAIEDDFVAWDNSSPEDVLTVLRTERQKLYRPSHDEQIELFNDIQARKTRIREVKDQAQRASEGCHGTRSRKKYIFFGEQVIRCTSLMRFVHKPVQYF